MCARGGELPDWKARAAFAEERRQSRALPEARFQHRLTPVHRFCASQVTARPASAVGVHLKENAVPVD
ncbi:hypothetical protein ANANG_G00128060 [Anguilla anguilla]|uniref:Uncharacterized protein n=1 Tax=Anguilla anguilla TaxID=7936 RepID=A0A9D3S014_ANGAN|nr:hypothetical protein ANANG_G00128060 [Anguilla anguilla]